MDVEFKQVYRPTIEQYFMEIARVVSTRSPDAQTQCGCVLVDKQNRIISTGYNGLPRGVNIENFPNTRPAKYDWMAHSEKNLILNSRVNPKDIGGATVYVTGPCCFNCLYDLWQFGVEEVWEGNYNIPKMVDQVHEDLKMKLVRETGMKVNKFFYDLDKYQDYISVVNGSEEHSTIYPVKNKTDYISAQQDHLKKYREEMDKEIDRILEDPTLVDGPTESLWNRFKKFLGC